MNPWLITWEAASDRMEATTPNKVAAILPNQNSDRSVEKVMYLLLANYHAHSGLSESIYVSSQIEFAKGINPYKAMNLGFDRLHCGSNPFLFARKVFKLKIKHVDGEDFLTWEENIYPIINPTEDVMEQVDRAKPFKRKQMVYDTRTNKIGQVEPKPSASSEVKQ